MTDSPLWHDGRVIGVIGVADIVVALDVEATAARLAEARITRLAMVTAELASCSDSDQLTGVVISHAADAIGARVASLSLLSDPETRRWSAYAAAPARPPGGPTTRWQLTCPPARRCAP